MEEPPGGEIHDWIKEDFLSKPGWGTERPPSDRPPGRPKTIDPELLSPKGIAAVERRVGVRVKEFQRLTRRGRPRTQDRQRRDEIAAKLRAVVEEGAVVTGLADVFGCDERTIWRLVKSPDGK